MPFLIKIKGGAGPVVRDLQRLPGTIRQMHVRALNRALAATRTLVVRDTRTQLALPNQKLARGVIRFERAAYRGARLDAFITVKPMMVPTGSNFPGQGDQGPAGTTLHGQFFRSAFKAKVGGKREGIWRRKGRARFPLERPKFDLRPTVGPAVARHARGRGREVFRRELDRLAALELRRKGQRAVRGLLS